MNSEPLPALKFELPVPALGDWRAGNTGTEGVWQFDAGRPGRHLMVAALVHGNELCGAWALLRLLRAGLRPRQGVLTLAFCNLAAFDRFDPQRPDASRFVDEDLNRVWGPGLDAADARRTSERERARQLRPFVEQADWLLDLHSMHEPGEPLLLTGLQPRNRALARTLGTPRCVIVDAGHRDGIRMRDHGRFGVVEPCGGDGGGDDGTRSLLIECGYHGELASREVATDITARFLVEGGALRESDVPPTWWREAPPTQSVLQVTDAVVATTPELRFAEPWANGQRIARAGTLLGWDGGQPIVTPADDCTIVMPSLRQLRVGVTVMRLARPLAEGG